MDLKIICLEDEAFYTLIEKVIERVKGNNVNSHDKWISGEEAMQRLRVSSKTTLQKLRDEGKIRFSQPQKKIILYDSDSINEYLEGNAYETKDKWI